jgi:hypothetical protein
MVGLHVPLPTLRRHPRGSQRTARVDAVRYSFIVVDLHHLLLAGLPAHPCENATEEIGESRGSGLKFLPVYKKAIGLTLAWRPAKHVRDRGHVPFAAPGRLDAARVEDAGD